MSKVRLDFDTAMKARKVPCPYCGKGLVWHEGAECLDRWAEKLILSAVDGDTPLSYSRGVGFGDDVYRLIEAVYKRWGGEVYVAQHQSGQGVCWAASFAEWFYGDDEPHWSVAIEGYRTRGQAQWSTHSSMWIKTPRLAITIAAIASALLNLGLVPDEEPEHKCRSCRHLNYSTSQVCEYCGKDPDAEPPPIPEGANVLTAAMLDQAFEHLKVQHG